MTLLQLTTSARHARQLGDLIDDNRNLHLKETSTTSWNLTFEDQETEVYIDTVLSTFDEFLEDARVEEGIDEFEIILYPEALEENDIDIDLSDFYFSNYQSE